MSWLITPSAALVDDPDAMTYLAAVEAADGQALESATRLAVNAFIKGCKADGIWPAIKASCILAGARTLTGALVPLVGSAPTNFNFVSGDYNRKTGLVGDGSTKYLNSNRNNNADPQNSSHVSAYVTTQPSSTAYAMFIGMGGASTSANTIEMGQFPPALSVRCRAANGSTVSAQGLTTGLKGVARSAPDSFVYRSGGTSGTITAASGTPQNTVLRVYADQFGANFSNARLAFYSIGESLDLAALDARVTALVNAFAAAIP
jgi:hypothetical protein